MEDFEAQHRAVLDEALDIYVKNSQVRGQLWLTMPPSDKIRELDERVKRLQAGYEALDNEAVRPENSSIAPILEADALDMINYAVFFIRQVREGARG